MESHDLSGHHWLHSNQDKTFPKIPLPCKLRSDEMSSALDFFPTKTMTLSDGSILTMKSVKIPRFSSSPPSIIKTFQENMEIKLKGSSRLITGHTVTSWDDGQSWGRILMWTRQFPIFKGQEHINLKKPYSKGAFSFSCKDYGSLTCCVTVWQALRSRDPMNTVTGSFMYWVAMRRTPGGQVAEVMMVWRSGRMSSKIFRIWNSRRRVEKNFLRTLAKARFARVDGVPDTKGLELTHPSMFHPLDPTWADPFLRLKAPIRLLDMNK